MTQETKTTPASTLEGNELGAKAYVQWMEQREFLNSLPGRLDDIESELGDEEYNLPSLLKRVKELELMVSGLTDDDHRDFVEALRAFSRLSPRRKASFVGVVQTKMKEAGLHRIGSVPF